MIREPKRARPGSRGSLSGGVRARYLGAPDDGYILPTRRSSLTGNAFREDPLNMVILEPPL